MQHLSCFLVMLFILNSHMAAGHNVFNSPGRGSHFQARYPGCCRTISVLAMSITSLLLIDCRAEWGSSLFAHTRWMLRAGFLNHDASYESSPFTCNKFFWSDACICTEPSQYISYHELSFRPAGMIFKDITHPHLHHGARYFIPLTLLPKYAKRLGQSFFLLSTLLQVCSWNLLNHFRGSHPCFIT